MFEIETNYLEMIKSGAPSQLARGILPNDIKTEIIMTANIREWIHVFNLRCAKDAHPDIRNLMLDLLFNMKIKFEGLFDHLIFEN